MFAIFCDAQIIDKSNSYIRVWTTLIMYDNWGGCTVTRKSGGLYTVTAYNWRYFQYTQAYAYFSRAANSWPLTF